MVAGSVLVVTSPESPIRRPIGAGELLPIPSVGRVFHQSRQVRWGDVDSGGRLRLDAIARLLQDIATDDTAELALVEPEAWVVRRTLIDQARPAQSGELLELSTFCSGIGSRWAERRIVITGDLGARIDAVALWVHLDPISGRPKLLPPRFRGDFAAAAAGREVTARQVIDPVLTADPGVITQQWHPRSSDIDILDHVNNAIGWAVVEQVLATQLAATGFFPGSAGDPRADSFRAAIEFRDAIGRDVAESGMALPIASVFEGRSTRLTVWSADASIPHLSAAFEPLT
jgi:acyl-ACP thioesterase